MVYQQLNDVFCKVFNVPELVISDEMTASDVPNWDSVTHVLLILEVETTFGIQLSTSEIARLKNVGDLRVLLEAKLQQA